MVPLTCLTCKGVPWNFSDDCRRSFTRLKEAFISTPVLVHWTLLCSLYFAPIIFAIPGDRTPNLTMILITTNHYTPYPKYRPWPRLSHSLMAVRLMFTSWQTKKLSDKYWGPFMIIAKPGTHSLTLWLPDSMRSVHPVFHVSQLEVCVLNTIPNCVQPPLPPIEVDGEPEYKIKETLDSKIDQRRCHCQLLYLVRWLGYTGTDDETSWLLATELGNMTELLEDFHWRYPNKPGPIPS